VTRMTSVKRALVSVSDKTGLVELGEALDRHGVTIVSTGSTAATLREAGIPVTDVSDVTGFREALDGRVKTLHPSIHGGILADRRLESHREQLEELDIEPFDAVVVNLYPFEATVERGAGFDEAIENIDIGGPAMVRAAAKNHASVAIVVDPGDYDGLIDEIASGGVSEETRVRLAAKAFAHTANYDGLVAGWMAQQRGATGVADGIHLVSRPLSELRYGENSHQAAALYERPSAPKGLAQARIVQGKAMSFNNYLDANAALLAAFDHDSPAVAIIKHQNPCGIATGNSLLEAYKAAHACDPVSAFGGVIAVNRELDAATAEAIAEVFTEVIVAPSVSDEAAAVLSSKKNLRLVVLPEGFALDERDVRMISGGLLVQERDQRFAPASTWECVAGEPADPATLATLEFAWRAVKSVKSNAILLAQGTASVGIGMGQVNRVDSCHLAVSRAGDRASGSVAASDAFFPFADGLEILIAAGVRAVVQPGGSVRDDEVIAAAAAAGVTLYLTGERHFLH
jgi:phosphoribosylaminoimidazolecarboxamide formyltransferase/IMP cyclohydrolase